MQESISKKEVVILSGSLALLVLMVLFNQRPPFFDEALYLRDIEVLHRYGFTTKFLLELTGSAGPLYAVIHYLLEPLTQLQPPFIRVVNILFLLGTIYFTNKTINLSGLDLKHFGLYAMAIPMTYVVSGLALTEMPAMFFLSIGLFGIIYVNRKERISFPLEALIMIGSGFCLGISITGRQPYLALLGALPIPFLDNLSAQWIKKLSLLIILIICSLALPSYLFYIWNGLVPPTDAALYDDIAKSGTPYRLDFFFLCIAYYAVAIFFIAPDFYNKGIKLNRLLLIIGFFIISIINYLFHLMIYLPFHGLTKKIFTSETSQLVASVVIGSVLIAIALSFIFHLFRQAIRFSKNKLFFFYSFSLLLIALTCTKVTWGFSSRYAAQAIPLLLLTAAFLQDGRRRLLIPGVGVIFGLYSLMSYILS